MKIVIDMPEKTVNDIKDNAMFAGTIPSEILWDVTSAIGNGTPLPKGHGRLVDADALTEQLETVANDEWNKQVGASKGLEDAIDIVEDVPTIIEADKEGE